MTIPRWLIVILVPFLTACVTQREHDRIAANAAREVESARQEATAARSEADRLQREFTKRTAEKEPCPEAVSSTPDPDIEELVRSGGDLPEQSEHGVQVNVIRLHYATDRAASGSRVPMTFYGSKRNEELQFGTCIVSIPYRHKPGVLETESWTQLDFVPNVNEHVVLLTVRPLGNEAFLSDLRARVAASPSKSALVFIHGYNVTFSTAARRTAQIVYDIGYRGVPIVYSWPSYGELEDYLGDEGNAAWTALHLRKFLEQIASTSGATSIHIIAHSMGNRPLVDALERLSSSNWKLFDKIVLAAPDIDAGIFSNAARQVVAMGKNVTLYASSNDKALRASRIAHTKQPRAGEAGEHLLIVDGVDTIDASGVDTGFFGLGHSYVGENTLALTDLGKLIVEQKSPASRGLRRLTRASRTFWQLVIAAAR